MIQPIVLVGGRSRRFGRDKLREQLPFGANEWLVDRPIAALRHVFGARIALVGDCHADLHARGDLVIEDHYPGVGPAGGILSALEATRGDIFVLSGDLPAMTPEAVRAVLQAAAQSTSAWAVLAMARSRGDDAPSRLEPCIGIYRHPCLSLLRAAIARGHRSLYDLVPPETLATAEIDAAATVNVNTGKAMAAWMASKAMD